MTYARCKLKQFYVYIMSNKSHTLYTGITNNLERRVGEHKNKVGSVFTARYHCTRLVYFEMTTDVRGAIAREKAIKGMVRKKKIALIQSNNPDWLDLSLSS
ncbi:MAG TPA: GIY-YIG nuclease family protein [Thermoanaerobaculia bacterium]|nr:GIY-YIG nuclease family protein [Thermoanaerobaculia bacterium]